MVYMARPIFGNFNLKSLMLFCTWGYKRWKFFSHLLGCFLKLESGWGKVASKLWRCCSSARGWRKRGWSWKTLDFAGFCQVDQRRDPIWSIIGIGAAMYCISLCRFSASSSWFSLFPSLFHFEASFVCASFCISFSGFLPFFWFFLQASKKSTFMKAEVKQGRGLIWVMKDVVLYKLATCCSCPAADGWDVGLLQGPVVLTHERWCRKCHGHTGEPRTGSMVWHGLHELIESMLCSLQMSKR